MLFVSFSFKSSWEKCSVLQGGGTCLGSKNHLFRSMDLQSQPAADLHLQFPSYTGRFIRERWGRQSQAGGCIKNLALCYFSKVRSTSMDWFPLERERKQSFKKNPSLMLVLETAGNFLSSSILEQAPSGGAARFCWMCGKGAQTQGEIRAVPPSCALGAPCSKICVQLPAIPARCIILSRGFPASGIAVQAVHGESRFAGSSLAFSSS